MVLVFPRDALSAVAEQHQCRRPSDVRRLELNASDASGGVHPDAVAGDCPSEHPVHLADAGVGKSADRGLDVHLAGAHPACCWLPDSPDAPARNTPAVVQSAEQSAAELAGPGPGAPAARVHLVEDAAPERWG